MRLKTGQTVVLGLYRGRHAAVVGEVCLEKRTKAGKGSGRRPQWTLGVVDALSVRHRCLVWTRSNLEGGVVVAAERRKHIVGLG